MIYGRFGDAVAIQRYATAADVTRLEHRKPDKQDKQALESHAYVVVKSIDDDRERLYHIGYLRADDGLKEIMQALEPIA